MSVELGLAAELGAACLGGSAAVVCPLHDALPLVLCESTQKGDESAPDRCGEIEVGLIQDLQELTDRSIDAPIINLYQQAKLSHSP